MLFSLYWDLTEDQTTLINCKQTIVREGLWNSRIHCDIIIQIMRPEMKSKMYNNFHRQATHFREIHLLMHSCQITWRGGSQTGWREHSFTSQTDRKTQLNWMRRSQHKHSCGPPPAVHVPGALSSLSGAGSWGRPRPWLVREGSPGEVLQHIRWSDWKARSLCQGNAFKIGRASCRERG